MSKGPSLLPKEHGAYAELAFPMATGLAMTAPTWPALAMAAAAVCFFLANEPVAVLLGARGGRLKNLLRGRAALRAGILLGLGVLLGLAGGLGAGPTIWRWLLIPGGAGVLLIPVVLSGGQKSVPGELLVVTVFSTLLLPLAAASGGDPVRACLAAGVWWISFALGTLEVHAIKARNKDTARSRWTILASPMAAAVVVLAAVWASRVGGAVPFLPTAGTALLPPAVAVLALSLLRVHPKRLKRVGWTLVGANSLTLLTLLLG